MSKIIQDDYLRVDSQEKEEGRNGKEERLFGKSGPELATDTSTPTAS